MAETAKKKNNTLVWVIVILIIIVVVYFLMNRKPAALPTANQLSAPADSKPVQTTYVSVDDNTILKRGMNNAHVGKLQTLINKVNTSYGLPQITVDNAFGSGTESALNKLTGKNQITYAEAERMARDKFKAQGYPDSYASSILSGLTFGLFS